MANLTLNIAKEFSPTPGPRYEEEGEWSGEQFRKSFLFPKVKQAIEGNYILQIILDGAVGYGTSFLEEIFGGLIREHHLKLKDVKNHIQIVSEEEKYLKDDIEHYLQDASRKQ